eukprot:SAG31_NODE_5071_length_2761_cov_4.024793_2_plen_302_part_00
MQSLLHNMPDIYSFFGQCYEVRDGYIAPPHDADNSEPTPAPTPPIDTTAESTAAYVRHGVDVANNAGAVGEPWAALPAPDSVLTTIGFGSCAHQAFPQPFWDSLTGLAPQLFIYGGDNVYGDCLGRYAATPEEDCHELQDAYLAVRPCPEATAPQAMRTAHIRMCAECSANLLLRGSQLQGHPSFYYLIILLLSYLILSSYYFILLYYLIILSYSMRGSQLQGHPSFLGVKGRLPMVAIWYGKQQAFYFQTKNRRPPVGTITILGSMTATRIFDTRTKQRTSFFNSMTCVMVFHSIYTPLE